MHTRTNLTCSEDLGLHQPALRSAQPHRRCTALRAHPSSALLSLSLRLLLLNTLVNVCHFFLPSLSVLFPSRRGSCALSPHLRFSSTTPFPSRDRLGCLRLSAQLHPICAADRDGRCSSIGSSPNGHFLARSEIRSLLDPFALVAHSLARDARDFSLLAFGLFSEALWSTLTAPLDLRPVLSVSL